MRQYFLFALLALSSAAFAASGSEVKYFYSNNTEQLDLEHSFAKIFSQPQSGLHTAAASIFQGHTGRYENVFGIYKMANKNDVVAENAEIFVTTPMQFSSRDEMFKLALKLAKQLHQESVGLFIPSATDPVGDIIVTITSQKMNVPETIKIVRKKIPSTLLRGYTIHLSDRPSGFFHTNVTQIEWLGSKITLEKIKKAFPQEAIAAHHGQAYLVYSNGNIERI